MKTRKVFVLGMDTEERAEFGKVIRALHGNAMPRAAESLQSILAAVDAGQHLTSRQVEDMRVWLDRYGSVNNLTRHMDETLWHLVR